MSVSLSLHGVKKIELKRTSISVIREDRIPYEVWDLYILHGDEENEEDFSISLFMKKKKSLKLDSMIYEDEDRSPEYKFGIHRGIGSPENPDDRKILEENPEKSDITLHPTYEELERLAVKSRMRGEMP